MASETNTSAWGRALQLQITIAGMIAMVCIVIWGLTGGGEPVELHGGDPDTTNNRMELTAAIEGLRSLPAGAGACVVTDSLLMLKSMTLWLAGWKRKGWKTAGGQPVKNQDLLRALDAEVARVGAVRWHWVRGHETGAQHAHKALNDRADRLAVAAAQAAA